MAEGGERVSGFERVSECVRARARARVCVCMRMCAWVKDVQKVTQKQSGN